MVVMYLHGFASSPLSSKATQFAERFAARGVEFVCPDLNEPEFAALSVTRMLEQVEKQMSTLEAGEVVLIGSSLGAFVAVEAAARQVNHGSHPISHLVLLAPAVRLEWDRWPGVGPEGVAGWHRAGHVEVFHHAYDRSDRLKYAFYTDAEQYHPADRQLSLPILIFQGLRDESVSPAMVREFARAQPAATLHLTDDDHQLKSSFGFICNETFRFLGLE